MPELAEVEYVARQMRATVVGARIVRVDIQWPGTIAHPPPADFAEQIVGRTILGVDRRAKVLLIALSGDRVLTVHRRMSGNLELAEAGETRIPLYLRVTFALDDGRAIHYTDPRKFGRMALWSAAELPTALAAFGPEPLSPEFTAERLGAILHGRGRAIKALLLDQTAIAGLGNIYADEALFQAMIHPLRSADSLDADEIRRLRDAIVAVLHTGIVHGGTTFGRHRGFFGEVGTNLDHLQIYQRTGQPCVRCGTPVARIIVAQRGTHFCPECQVL